MLGIRSGKLYGSVKRLINTIIQVYDKLQDILFNKKNTDLVYKKLALLSETNRYLNYAKTFYVRLVEIDTYLGNIASDKLHTLWFTLNKADVEYQALENGIMDSDVDISAYVSLRNKSECLARGNYKIGRNCITLFISKTLRR